MNPLKLILLALIICNVPGIIRFSLNEALGSSLSYLSFGLLAVYFFLSKKNNPLWPLIIFGVSFFIISGVVDIPYVKDYNVEFLKYMILVVCGAELARNTTSNELLLFHAIGALSVLAHALFFIDDYGRYSGFFTDPNEAGFVCSLAFALSFSIKKETIKIFFVFLTTFCGILTFSRTFLVIWLLLTIISIIHSWKNLKILGIGAGVMILFLSISYFFELNTIRFGFLENIFNSGGESVNSINLNSRANVWSSYYEEITSSPIFGNGYLSFMGIEDVKPGVHNSYLRVIGEAGIIPFFIFIGIFFGIFKKGLTIFWKHPYVLLLTSATILFLMTNHTFTANKNIIFITIWLYAFVISQSSQNDSKQIIEDEPPSNISTLNQN